MIVMLMLMVPRMSVSVPTHCLLALFRVQVRAVI